MAEIWKQIEECPDYDVSNLGRVRRQYKKHITYLDGYIDDHGYRRFCLRKDGTRKNCRLHVMLGKAFLTKEKPEYTIIDHIDRNRLNNNLDNLRYVNYSINKINAPTYRDDITETDPIKRRYILQKECKEKAIYKEKSAKKITCDCGSIYRFSNRSYHFKTKKHIDYINSQ